MQLLLRITMAEIIPHCRGGCADDALEYGTAWSPRLLDGERATPLEDAGGPPGFMDVIKASKGQSHPRHEEIRNWVWGAHTTPA